MKPGFPRTRALLLGATLAAVLLAGCGGGTKTVSVASAPLPEATTATPATTSQTSTSTTPATTPTSTTPAPSEHGGTSGPGATTRTAPAPAFTHEGGTGTTGSTAEGLSAAEAVLQAKGYTASSTSDYHPNQTLRVLVGTHSGSAEGGQQAFFFVDGRYIGTDAKQPSASVHVVSQGDTEVTLAYALSGGDQATVRFQLNNGKLVPLGAIPPASSRQ
jgi:LppP/LprE lipoprotein